MMTTAQDWLTAYSQVRSLRKSSSKKEKAPNTKLNMKSKDTLSIGSNTSSSTEGTNVIGTIGKADWNTMKALRSSIKQFSSSEKTKATLKAREHEQKQLDRLMKIYIPKANWVEEETLLGWNSFILVLPLYSFLW